MDRSALAYASIRPSDEISKAVTGRLLIVFVRTGFQVFVSQDDKKDFLFFDVVPRLFLLSLPL